MCFLTSCWMESGVVGDLKRHDTLINRCDIIKLLRSKMYLINTPYYHHWSRKPTDNIKCKISNVYGNQAGSCCNSICLSESNKLSRSWKASALNSSFLTYGESCHLSIKQPDGKWCRYYLVSLSIRKFSVYEEIHFVNLFNIFQWVSLTLNLLVSEMRQDGVIDTDHYWCIQWLTFCLEPIHHLNQHRGQSPEGNHTDTTQGINN